MSCLPDNIKTALICHERQTSNSDLSVFLFEVACHFAKKGLRVCFLTNVSDKKVPKPKETFYHPEILQRIIFRYLKSPEEVIRWCHEVHYLQKKPLVLLIMLDQFSKPDKFNIIKICAALIDSLMYFGNVNKSQQFYLLATVTLDSDIYLSQLNNFFHSSWLCMETNSNTLLKTVGNKEHMSHEITVNSATNFDEIKQIFVRRPYDFTKYP